MLILIQLFRVICPQEMYLVESIYRFDSIKQNPVKQNRIDSKIFEADIFRTIPYLEMYCIESNLRVDSAF